ncbi:MAG: hypothetical protein HY938_01405 [Nitrosomonadales bacterium]|nr:hypothetical protein [Nitrosomonadales bacterium]
MPINKIIVVLGMHRSGTSAITRGLQVLDVDLGDKLIGGIAGNNEKGFWEDAEVNDFNNALLVKLGSAWDRLNAIDELALMGPKLLPERDQAKELLRSKLRSDSIFAFKDPRTAVLLPFWQSVFDALGLTASYLIVVRNPMEVAESLSRRDGISLLKGMLLWVKYSVAAVRGTQGAQRVFVSYAAMMHNPRLQLKRISQALYLPSPEANPQGLFEYTEEFLGPELRHNVSAVDALLAPGQIPPFVSNFYHFLLQLTGDKIPPNGEEVERAWPTIEGHYADFVPLLNQFDQLEHNERAAQPDESQTQISSSGGEFQERQPQFRTLRSFIDHLGSVYSDFTKYIYRWNLESIQEGSRLQTDEGRMVVSGWVVGNAPTAVHIATRQDGVTRCYPLNVERPDVVQAVLNERPSGSKNPICGFRHVLKSDTAFDIGFEVDGWIFWLYSGEPAPRIQSG